MDVVVDFGVSTRQERKGPRTRVMTALSLFRALLRIRDLASIFAMRSAYRIHDVVCFFITCGAFWPFARNGALKPRALLGAKEVSVIVEGLRLACLQYNIAREPHLSTPIICNNIFLGAAQQG